MTSPLPTKSQRLEALEIKASFTEDLLDQLNLTIYQQQQLIDRLTHEVIQLRQQAPEAGSNGPRNLRDELPRTIERRGGWPGRRLLGSQWPPRSRVAYPRQLWGVLCNSSPLRVRMQRLFCIPPGHLFLCRLSSTTTTPACAAWCRWLAGWPWWWALWWPCSCCAKSKPQWNRLALNLCVARCRGHHLGGAAPGAAGAGCRVAGVGCVGGRVAGGCQQWRHQQPQPAHLSRSDRAVWLAAGRPLHHGFAGGHRRFVCVFPVG